MSQFSADDHVFMARALRLAERGLYTARPNPMVGCVLAAKGDVVGEGFHLRAGEAHAEAMALQAAGERARGATAYVTLEPCAHQGRTPPCADALVAAGVTRVVAATRDPFDAVNGAGLAKLREAGIAVIRDGARLGDIGAAIVETASFRESSITRLSALLGGAERGNREFIDAVKIAERTPYSVEQVVNTIAPVDGKAVKVGWEGTNYGFRTDTAYTGNELAQGTDCKMARP